MYEVEQTFTSPYSPRGNATAMQNIQSYALWLT